MTIEQVMKIVEQDELKTIIEFFGININEFNKEQLIKILNYQNKNSYKSMYYENYTNNKKPETPIYCPSCKKVIDISSI